MANIQFSSRKSEGEEAVVVSFDLCGFSNFCNHADAYIVLPKFIAALFDEVDAFFLDWIDALGKDFDSQKLSAPDFMKYTGDGALMIWLLPGNVERRQKYCTAIVRAMHNLQKRLSEVIPGWEINWQTHGLPSRARFGIAKGLVYPLRRKSNLIIDGEIIDYAGYCINLAVRLQNHCPEVGFLVHELVFPKLDGLMKYIAHGMKGTQQESVLMFVSDVPPMTLDYIKSKFLPCGNELELRCEATNRVFDTHKGTTLHRGVEQPRFEAHLIGPENRRQDMFIGHQRKQLIFIEDIKDSSGKTVREEKWFFQLTAVGPPLIYTFTHKEPFTDGQSSQSPKKLA
jgi:class 3 adenylate cyclase